MSRYIGSRDISTKPVDYYKPLSVDVSVEYELPKEVAPPPGSAPLLVIHPSAFFRSSSSSLMKPKPDQLSTTAQNYTRHHLSRHNQSKNVSSSDVSQISKSNLHAGNTNTTTTTSNSNKLLDDINSTLYYLTKRSRLPVTNNEDHVNINSTRRNNHTNHLPKTTSGREQQQQQQQQQSMAAARGMRDNNTTITENVPKFLKFEELMKVNLYCCECNIYNGAVVKNMGGGGGMNGISPNNFGSSSASPLFATHNFIHSDGRLPFSSSSTQQQPPGINIHYNRHL